MVAVLGPFEALSYYIHTYINEDWFLRLWIGFMWLRIRFSGELL
jgi:hypothetical protein